ncbi:PIN domain-containing protein [Romeria aff. gracilis LEGE 07310]|uniref:Ribonuclease VapC n=1 Tax=Vasconcelosia minhoensis LEGE 07310 TaxID=915328 RepID=A0A8J7AA68_9CYAN|nr:TA system VapC family ribonuclease toxin [Romeria gracilis]MBE9080327.1 PIN domain-containing protein [Romeria aff. gracilis LEGE 07310]
MQMWDVNILINAYREENSGHEFYNQWLKKQLGAAETFLYCDWILSSFVRIVTHPKIYKTSTPPPEALEFVKTIRSQPNALGIMPGASHWQIFTQLCLSNSVKGNLIPDAYLAALAVEANALWISADEDYKIFEPTLTWQLLRP